MMGLFPINMVPPQEIISGISAPQVLPISFPTGLVLDDHKALMGLESGNGMALQSGTGSLSQDTDDHISGEQSLQMVTDGAGGPVFCRETSLSPVIDLTGKYLRVRFKCSNVAAITEFWLYLSSDNFASGFYTFKLSDDLSQMRDNVWHTLTLSFGEATVSNSPDRSSINSIQWRIKDDSSATVTCNWDNWEILDEPTKGIVSVEFDDSWLSQYTEGFKKMSENGFPGTIFVIPDLVGTSGYCSLAQLRELHDNYGWAMSAHGRFNFTTFTTPALRFELRRTIKWLKENGFTRGIYDVSYTNGGRNTDVITVCREFFRSGRTIANYAETLPPGDPFNLRCEQALNSTPTATINSLIQNAGTHKHHCRLLYHLLVTTPVVSTERSITDFGTDMDNLKAAVDAGTVDVMTSHEAYNLH